MLWLLTALGALAFVVGAMLVLGRVSLAFPAVAVDERRMTPSTSWKFTVGNSWRLLAASALVVGPTSFAQVLLDGALSPLKPTIGSMALIAAAETSLLLVAAALAASFVSLAYRHFTGREPNADLDVPPASYFS